MVRLYQHCVDDSMFLCLLRSKLDVTQYVRDPWLCLGEAGPMFYRLLIDGLRAKIFAIA